jgi:hypothetical protein
LLFHPTTTTLSTSFRITPPSIPPHLPPPQNRSSVASSAAAS